MIKVFFDASPALLNFGGIPVFSRNLLQNLAECTDIELHSGISVLYLNTHWQYYKLLKNLTGNRCKYHPHFIPGRFADIIPFSNFRAKKYDLMHYSTHTAPSYCTPSDFSNTILTIHDMFLWHDEYQSKNPEMLSAMKRKLPVQAEKAKAIITISEFSKQEINKFIGIPLEKIHVIPLAAQWRREALGISDVLLKNELEKKSYFLAVSTMLPHKNYVSLFAAFKKYCQSKDYAGEKLVVVGQLESCFTEILEALTSTRNVVHLENVSENDLRALYENSKGFFLVSKIEGFGIPLLEAMSCKIPACYGKGSAMDELGRNAAWGVDPDNIDEISTIFSIFSAGGKEVEAKVDEAFKISLGYSYRKTAESCVAIYKKLLHK